MRFVEVSTELFLSALYCSFVIVNGNTRNLVAANGVHPRILTDSACSNDIDPPCSEVGQFCNFDAGLHGFCEACTEHPDACDDLGLPESGTVDCTSRCAVPKECSNTNPCTEGYYFCNFDYGESGGICEYCNYINVNNKDEECLVLGLPDAGTESCVLSCNNNDGDDYDYDDDKENERAECSRDNLCSPGLFCNFDFNGEANTDETGHCEECVSYMNIDDCFNASWGLSELSVSNCVSSCGTVCWNETIANSSFTGLGYADDFEQIYEAPALTGSPDGSVSGNLADCAYGYECPTNVTNFVCLIQRGGSLFSDKVIACEESGGVAAVIYNNEECDTYSEDITNCYSTFTLGGVETTIPSIAIPMELGLLLMKNALGSSANLNLESLGEQCRTECSDMLPCNEGSFCNFDFGESGFCENCYIDRNNFNKCFFEGIPLKGAQDCGSKCTINDNQQKCKFCSQEISITSIGEALSSQGEDSCVFCPEDDMDYNIQTKKFTVLASENVTCFLTEEFFTKYAIPKDDKTCQLAQMMNYQCGCTGSGYMGANTMTKKSLLVWLPRIMAILSFIGSAYIIVDVVINKEKRGKTINQLMVGVSIFDLIGSAAYALTSLPAPKEDYIYGSLGSSETCTAQGFFIQIGTISAFMNVSSSVYLFLVVKLGWRERKIKKIKVWLFVCPISVGLVLAFLGLPHYDNMILWCNNSADWWPEIPMAIAIFIATVMIVLVCNKVRKTDSASKHTTNGAARISISSLVFWQSFWYLMVFYATWPPYLVMQYLWASGRAYTSYGLILFAGTVVPMQGIWNFIVYVMRKNTNRRQQSSIPETVTKFFRRSMPASLFGSMPAKSAMPAKSSSTMLPPTTNRSPSAIPTSKKSLLTISPQAMIKSVIPAAAMLSLDDIDETMSNSSAMIQKTKMTKN